MDQLNRSRAILFAGILLGGYIVLLIGLVYVGQQHLRQSLYDQAHLALEKQAAAVGYFITEQQGEVGELAGSSILDSFFANRALGMSMQYGLRASLLAVRDELERLRRRKQLQGASVYSRISLVDKDGTVLITVGNATDQPEKQRVTCPLDTAVKGVSLHLGTEKQDCKSHIYATVEYRNQVSGFIVAEINLARALSSLLQQPGNGELGNQLVLVAPEGAIVISARGGDTAVEQIDSDDLLAVPVPGTDFMLQGSVVLGAGQGLLTSPWFLFALSLITLPVLGGVYYLLRLNNRNLLLQTRYFSSRRRQKELRHFREQLDLSTDLCCQPWRAKRRLVVPSSREAALLTRRAHSARGEAK
ncbi:hypothetical protein [Thiolapillus sp.]|uniref:hypothetical protein n=1 Tax=Thiolapillus sp. TaxID=2017437 RepID=UPI003AF6BC38